MILYFIILHKQLKPGAAMKTKTFSRLQASKPNSVLFAFCLTILLFSATGSSIIPTDQSENELNLKEKKLGLLEKLEQGSRITREEIRSSFSSDLVCQEPLIMTSKEFIDLFEDLRKDMEEIGKTIGDIRDSEEFRDAMEEFRRQKEEMKNELDRVREEVRKARIEIREIDFGTIM